eukprot:1138535-Pelagomonas_calceolata.AAC.2
MGSIMHQYSWMRLGNLVAWKWEWNLWRARHKAPPCTTTCPGKKELVKKAKPQQIAFCAAKRHAKMYQSAAFEPEAEMLACQHVKNACSAQNVLQKRSTPPKVETRNTGTGAHTHTHAQTFKATCKGR